MGFWDNLGDGILSGGGVLTEIGIGKWILIGIGVSIVIAVLILK